MPLFLSPVCNGQTFDANGDPLTSGQIETYLAGSSTQAATYTDDSGSTLQSNPIVLNSLGFPTLGPIWLTGGLSYKFVIKDAMGVTLRTIDNISGVNDASVSQSEWVQSGFTPTYINATSFSVPGDQTAILQVGRRLQTTNTSGLVYSTISNSVFAAGITTVTVVNDSTTLDAGLSGVAYALLSANPLSVPDLPGSKITGAITSSGMTMATSRILGRTTASTGAIEEITVGARLSLSGGSLNAQAASTTQEGAVELATNAETQAGTDTTRAVTPAAMKAGLNASGTAPTYAPRAWCIFGPTGSVAAGGNVTSVTKIGTGRFQVNFATAMPDALYSVLANSDANSSGGLVFSFANGFINTSSSCLISIVDRTDTPRDPVTYCSVVVLR